MKELGDIFKEDLGIPFPGELYPERGRSPLVSLSPGLYGSGMDSLKIACLPIEDFVANETEYNYCAGFLNYGADARLILFSVTDEWRRIRFKIKYSEPAGDNSKLSGQLGKFLRRYADFEQRIKSRVKRFTFCAGCDGEYYEVIEPSGNKHSKRGKPGEKGSLLEAPDFMKEFSFLFNDYELPVTGNKVAPEAARLLLNSPIPRKWSEFVSGTLDLTDSLSLAAMLWAVRYYHCALDVWEQALIRWPDDKQLRFFAIEGLRFIKENPGMCLDKASRRTNPDDWNK